MVLSQITIFIMIGKIMIYKSIIMIFPKSIGCSPLKTHRHDFQHAQAAVQDGTMMFHRLSIRAIDTNHGEL